MSCSASSFVRSTLARFPWRTTPTISLRSWRRSREVGSGTSRTETSFSISGGMTSVGESRTTVVYVDLSACESSRTARTTAVSARNGWKSFRTTSAGAGGGEGAARRARRDPRALRARARRPEGLPPVPRRSGGRTRRARALARAQVHVHDGRPALADARHPAGDREGGLGPRRPAADLPRPPPAPQGDRGRGAPGEPGQGRPHEGRRGAAHQGRARPHALGGGERLREGDRARRAALPRRRRARARGEAAGDPQERAPRVLPDGREAPERGRARPPQDLARPPRRRVLRGRTPVRPPRAEGAPPPGRAGLR